MWTLGPHWDLFAHHSLLWSWRLVLIFHYKQEWPADWLYHILLPHLTRDTLQVEGPKLPMDCQHTTIIKTEKTLFRFTLTVFCHHPTFYVTALPVWCNLRDILAIHTWAMPKYIKVLYRRLQQSILPWWQTHTQDWNCANDVSYMITAGNERIW